MARHGDDVEAGSRGMAMVTNAVAARYRGGFMSVNAALQQAASGIATSSPASSSR